MASISPRVEIGRDLDQKGKRLRERTELGADAGDERAQAVYGLEVAQARRVRRADVDDQVVGDGGELTHGRAIVGRRLLGGGDPGLAHVDADEAGACPVHETGGGGLGAGVGKAHPVDEGAVGRRAGHARPVVAGLRQRRDRADLDEAETERQEIV